MPLFKKDRHEHSTNPNLSGDAGTGAGMRGRPGDPKYAPSDQATGQGTHSDFSAGQHYDHRPSGGVGTDAGVPSGQGYYAGSGPSGDHQIPSSAALSAGQQGSGQHAITGKVEHAVGSMIGSKSLKAKGIQKEQEAMAFKAQGSELAEAERHEREALMRRERAVAHGAHPDHRHLGGNPPASNTGGF